MERWDMENWNLSKLSAHFRHNSVSGIFCKQNYQRLFNQILVYKYDGMIETLMQIKVEATAKHEIESREKSILTEFLAFFGLRILMKRTDSMIF